MSERFAVVVAYFCIFLGVGVWVPYFPLYLSHIGFNGSEIGLIIGTQPALRWCGAFGWAYIADRWQVRHAVLSATALAGALIFIPLLWVHSLVPLLLLLASVSLLHGTLIPLLDATVMDHLNTLGGNYGRLRLWGSVGFVVGAAGSAPLVHALSPQVVPVLLVLSTLTVAPMMRRVPRGQHVHHADFRTRASLFSPSLAAFLAAALLLQISCGTFAGFYALHTARLGLPDTVPGIAYGLAVTAEIAVLYWARALLDRISEPTLLLVTLAVTAVRWSLSAYCTDVALVIGLQLGHIFSFSLFHVAALRLLSRLVPPQSSTSGQALYGGVSFGLGGSVGLALAGSLVNRFDTRGAFAAEALIAMLAFLPTLYLRRRLPRDIWVHESASGAVARRAHL
jgi:PPP family 3-phenylpropionic acid transporter